MKAPWRAPLETAVLVLSTPAAVWAGESAAPPGLPELALRAVAALAAVVALIVALAALARRLKISPGLRSANERLASLGRLELGGRREIRMVRVDDEVLILGVTPERIELLSSSRARLASDPAEIPVLRKLATSP
jgi:flagellar biogenesis protein FliO